MKDMKEIEGKVKLLIVPIPKEADDFRIIHGLTRLAYFFPKYNRVDIPKGKFRIVGKLSKITDEECMDLVEGYGEHNGWRNYLVESQYTEYLKKSPKESFISLLKSNKLFIKEGDNEPKMNHWGASMDDYIQFSTDKEEYDKMPEDFLIMRINE